MDTFFRYYIQFKSHLYNIKYFLQYLETINYCKDLKTSSVLLTIDESTEDTPLFACRVDDPNKADEIGSELNGGFTDMRMAIFTLPEQESNLVSRV